MYVTTNIMLLLMVPVHPGHPG